MYLFSGINFDTIAFDKIGGKGMKVNYDEKSDAMYIRFSSSPYYESNEVKEGIILDYDKKGRIIAIEILDASKNFPAPKSKLYSMYFEILRPHLKLAKK